jgi:hypothetical protein
LQEFNFANAALHTVARIPVQELEERTHNCAVICTGSLSRCTFRIEKLAQQINVTKPVHSLNLNQDIRNV